MEDNGIISIINAQIIEEERIFIGNIKIKGDLISEIAEEGAPFVVEGDVIDANGKYMMPGVIDEHVHFREAALSSSVTEASKEESAYTPVSGNIYTESRAAAMGGVTSFFDMPNTKPTTTTAEALSNKIALAQHKSIINYAFFPGATNDNISFLRSLPPRKVPGVKVFMGASTGNMLVDDHQRLKEIFSVCAQKGLPVMTHCEDSNLIAENTQKAISLYGNNPNVSIHSVIRDENECVHSTALALSLAEQTGALLLVAHVSTAKELDMISSCKANVRAEVCVGYLLFSNEDYAVLGSRIKCNPALKTPTDREMLRLGLTNGQVWSIATDHAPHLLSAKIGGALKAASGMPSVQFSLPLMLTLTDKQVLRKEDVVRLMCHHPAELFGIEKRGFIREGYKADLVIVSKLRTPHIITDKDVKSLCGWTPYINQEITWQVDTTICNGHIIFNQKDGFCKTQYQGQPITFSHDNRPAL